MSKRGLKKCVLLLLTFWLGLHTAALKAQTLPISYSGTSSSFGVDTYGLLSATGTYGGTNSLSLSGAGTRMFWDPYKAAFRAGYINGTQWDDSNIGAYSVAFGNSTTASGTGSVAMGSATASGPNSVAMGSGHATGPGAVALAGGSGQTAGGTDAVALGGNYMGAYGDFSFAVGYAAGAIGNYSIALGSGSQAMGTNAIAMMGGVANGNNSVAVGGGTTTSAYESFALGQYNVGLNSGGGSATATSWVATDPLFEVGNGTSSTHADALVVYKNGTAVLQGMLTAQGGVTLTTASVAQTDIPMFTGN